MWPVAACTVVPVDTSGLLLHVKLPRQTHLACCCMYSCPSRHMWPVSLYCHVGVNDNRTLEVP